ncbi:MAG: ATP-binding protein [Cytophagales bacterium]|nr:MAG: ATP-binding protein [Cytophagales bacterium]
MLRKFKVSNFKSFEKDIELDLTDIKKFEFNTNSIKNDVLNNVIIYGRNGVGKSNLAFAIFDIIEHLTDKNRNENLYFNYLNSVSGSNEASFNFEFLINSKIVVYEYKKLNYKTITYERFLIDGKEFALFDRLNDKQAKIKFKGSETLKTTIENSELSILKYIKNNSELEKNDVNSVFLDFFTFVDSMLYFRSLQENMYQGLDIGSADFLESIVKKNNVSDFELFLNKAGVDCKLKVINNVNRNSIAFNFDNGKHILFDKIASTGTMALALFYYWFQTIKENSKVSFLFIDEFDAFYHHSLSELVVEKLKETGVQFILTTHNTSIMTNDLLRPDCYFTMTKNKICSFSNSTQKELREAHNIEKMYKAGTFNVE